MVIRSVVVESVAADRNVLQIILAAVFHCLLPSVLWVYAPVNWGVGSVFQLQKIHIYFEDSTSIVLLIFCRYSQPQCKIVPPSKLTL